MKMYVEDLSAMERITEESILNEINCRLIDGQSYTFVGDVLLSLNSNDLPAEFPESVSDFSSMYLSKRFLRRNSPSVSQQIQV